MHEKLTDIQNSFWKAYKDFKETKDMRQYNIDMDKILDKYRHDKKELFDFCVSLKFAWPPIINGMKEWS